MAYQSQWRAQRDTILDIAQGVRDAHPSAWAKARAAHDDGEFIRRVAYACHLLEPSAGLNLKRGGPDLSKDVLAFPNPSGCRDAGGTHPGLELVDIIVSHERGDAHLGWGDVTQATIDAGVAGKWVQPAPVGGEAPVPAPKTPTPPAGPVCPDPAAHRPRPPIPDRGELLDEAQALDAFYADTREGLGREQGLSRDGRPDWEGVAAWLLDVYLVQRLAGKSRAEAREAYRAQIRASHEWKSKHPGGQG